MNSRVRSVLTVALCVSILSLVMFGCSPKTAYNIKFISDGVQAKTGFGFIERANLDTLKIPDGIKGEDGLTEDEAVAIALWNNAQFHSDLVDMGFARAELAEAGMLKNPVLSLLFPLGPKQLSSTFTLPLDILWQRPQRVDAATLNCEKVADNLIQHGLGLVRDVLSAYADLKLNQERISIVEDELMVYTEIAQIAASRQRAGDISELEEAAISLRYSQIKESAIQFKCDYNTSLLKFKNLLGILMQPFPMNLKASALQKTDLQDTLLLIKNALAYRPDLRAAELDIQSCGKRLGWEKSKIFSLIARLDASVESDDSYSLSPGPQLELPVLSWNQGGVAKAKVAMERSVKNYAVVKQSIIRDVLQAYHTYDAARKAYEILNEKELPVANKAVASGKNAYSSGQISYLEFLEFKKQLLEARLRLSEAEARLLKSKALLQYSVGGKVQ